MPIDPAGTTPGLTPEPPPAPPKVNMRCKRPGCDSIEAIEMTAQASAGPRLYRCAKCNMIRGVTTGGHIEI